VHNNKRAPKGQVTAFRINSTFNWSGKTMDCCLRQFSEKITDFVDLLDELSQTLTSVRWQSDMDISCRLAPRVTLEGKEGICPENGCGTGLQILHPAGRDSASVHLLPVQPAKYNFSFSLTYKPIDASPNRHIIKTM
jgi:hypothetical protein